MEYDPSESEIAYELPTLLRVYKNGRIERLIGNDIVPPSTDPKNGVVSKDITIIPESNITARLYLPPFSDPKPKLPLVVYFHGGGFCAGSPFTSKCHNYVNTLVAQARTVVVSVNYRKAPEHPIPTAYEDSWAALQWIISHHDRNGPEAWLNDHADFEHVFLAGESAGANIAHNLALVAGHPEFGLSIGLLGLALIHPYFWGNVPIGPEALQPEKKAFVERIWPLVCPSSGDNDDPRVNPVADGAPSLEWIGCRRVLVCVAEKDVLRDRGQLYYECLSRSGWMGVVEGI